MLKRKSDKISVGDNGYTRLLPHSFFKVVSGASSAWRGQHRLTSGEDPSVSSKFHHFPFTCGKSDLHIPTGLVTEFQLNLLVWADI